MLRTVAELHGGQPGRLPPQLKEKFAYISIYLTKFSTKNQHIMNLFAPPSQCPPMILAQAPPLVEETKARVEKMQTAIEKRRDVTSIHIPRFGSVNLLAFGMFF